MIGRFNMPGFDGTGPRERGPGTGRGRGGCRVFASLCDARRPPGKMFLSLAATLAAMIVKDALNPKGITRKTVNMLGSRIAGRLRSSENISERTVRTTEYEEISRPVKLK